MSKILIHLGPPKTGSTQLQALFGSNVEVLNQHSIHFYRYKLKKYLREYHKRSSKRFFNPLRPWCHNLPDKYFNEDIEYKLAIFSEEALSKITGSRYQIIAFDKRLSKRYSERMYLAVLREINSHVTSMISQSIKGIRRFSYKGCHRKLKNYSLDRQFKGFLESDLNLIVEKFSDLIVDSRSTENVSSLLEKILGTNIIEFNKIENSRNQSQEAEGTAILLAFNNVMKMILGKYKLSQLREEIMNSRRKLDLKILDQFPEQRKFYPFSRDEQLKYNDIQRLNSKKFINKFSRDWIDEIFTPVIKDKSVALISEFDVHKRMTALDILASHINECFHDLNIDRKPTPDQIIDTISHFLRNEKSVL